MQSRYYDSNTGRFINSDTPLIVAVDSESLFQYNIFAYCNNNPISYVDHGGDNAIAVPNYYEFFGVVSAAAAAAGPVVVGVGCIAVFAVSMYDLASSITYADKANSGHESTNTRYKGTKSSKKVKATKSNSTKGSPKKNKPVKKAKVKKVSKANKVLDKISNKIKTKDGKRIDLSKFDKKLKNGDKKGPGKWTISKDKSGHGGSKWKLLKDGDRVASLDKIGRVLRN